MLCKCLALEILSWYSASRNLSASGERLAPSAFRLALCARSWVYHAESRPRSGELSRLRHSFVAPSRRIEFDKDYPGSYEQTIFYIYLFIYSDICYELIIPILVMIKEGKPDVGLLEDPETSIPRNSIVQGRSLRSSTWREESLQGKVLNRMSWISARVSCLSIRKKKLFGCRPPPASNFENWKQNTIRKYTAPNFQNSTFFFDNFDL